MRKVMLVALATVVAVAASPHSGSASERLMRRYDHDRGLPAPEVSALVQDREGFLWFSTAAGLVRWDGREMRRVLPDTLAGRTVRIAPYDGGVIAGGSLGAFDLRQGQPPRQLRDAGGAPIARVWALRVDRRGRWWVLTERAVHRFAGGGPGDPPAARPLPAALEAEGPRRIAESPDGGLVIVTRSGLWQISAEDRARRLADIPIPADVLVMPDGTIQVLAWEDALFSWRGGQLQEAFRLSRAHEGRKDRGISLALRGGTLWVAYSSVLVALRTGAGPEIIEAVDGLTAGAGPLLVDREGSLWVGTFRGPLQLPEPETFAVARHERMRGVFTRFVAHNDEGVWASTWEGLNLITQDRGLPRAKPIDLPGMQLRLPLCRDHAGALWAGTSRRLFARTGGTFQYFDFPDILHYSWCWTDAATGSVWLGTTHGLYVTPGHPVPPRLVGEVPLDARGTRNVDRLTIDRRGRVWIAQDSRVCQAQAAAIAAGQAAPWTCFELGVPDISDLHPMPSGTVWVTGNPAGVLRFDGQRFVRLPGSLELPSLWTFRIQDATDGGVWLASAGGLFRVAEDLEAASGWRELERIGAWNGLPDLNLRDVVEVGDGSLWIASQAGPIWLPASARRGPGAPPPVELVEVRASGHRVRGERIDLDPDHNALELRFAALSFRDPRLLRYRVRVGIGDWSTPTETPHVTLADLAPGPHAVEVAASLDGRRWSQPRRLSVTVRPHWYARPWVWAAGLALLAALAVALHRLRLAHSLRLERQRLRIAMDLHDEMGSGLGSIGVLAEVAANGVDDVTRRALAARIAATAGDLGGALGDIVWSLRESSANLAAAMDRLRARATALFSEGDPTLSLALPTPVPSVPLTPAVARAVQMVGQEALHNVHKHAGARNVTLALTAAGRGRWRLIIEDDGRGVAVPSAAPGTRLGLEGMRKRVAAIAGELRVEPGPSGRGTRVELTFSPRAEDRRVLSRLRRRARVVGAPDRPHGAAE
jgi:signal transduction histidine kinase/ligand-binding sensor domain-containing protein